MKQAQLSGFQFRDMDTGNIKREDTKKIKEKEILGHPPPTFSQNARGVGPRVLSTLFTFV